MDVLLHPRIAELLAHLAAVRTELASVVAQVPPAQQDLVPWEGSWTPSQIVEHLALTEASVARLLLTHVRDARRDGLGTDPDDSPILPTVAGDRIQRRGRAAPSPEPWHPRPDVTMAEARQSIAASRAALIEALHELNGLALGEVKAPHPLIGDLNMYQWVAFSGFHEARHANQLREILERTVPAGR